MSIDLRLITHVLVYVWPCVDGDHRLRTLNVGSKSTGYYLCMLCALGQKWRRCGRSDGIAAGVTILRQEWRYCSRSDGAAAGVTILRQEWRRCGRSDGTAAGVTARQEWRTDGRSWRYCSRSDDTAAAGVTAVRQKKFVTQGYIVWIERLSQHCHKFVQVLDSYFTACPKLVPRSLRLLQDWLTVGAGINRCLPQDGYPTLPRFVNFELAPSLEQSIIQAWVRACLKFGPTFRCLLGCHVVSHVS